MNVLLISTLRHNPGDDFIRLGVEYLLRRVFPDANFLPIQKHDPRSLFEGFRLRRRPPHRLLAPLLYRCYAASAGRFRTNRIEAADLVVFAGTPFIWKSRARILPSTCSNAPWVTATWQRLFTDLKSKPLLNLAAGTSVTDAHGIEEILSDRRVARFIRRAVGRTALTTARDRVTQKIVGELGFEVPLIPCASILAGRAAGLKPQAPQYVAVNLMPSAAHSWRGQRGHPARWRRTISAALPEIERRHPVLLVSHSRDEDRTAAAWFPGRRRFFSPDPIELLNAYSKAYYGLCNRVHAAAAIASFGRPALVVGGDSRINLIEQFGLPALDHRGLEADKLIAAVQHLERKKLEYARLLQDRAFRAESEYVASIIRAFDSGWRDSATRLYSGPGGEHIGGW